MNFLGIDIGTSGCKVGIFDENGQQLAFSRRSYEVIFSNGGGAELDSQDVIRKCFEAIRECTQQVKPGSVKALSISSQGEAFTAVGPGGEILSNAMVSSDSRSAPFIKPLVNAIGEERLYHITGHTAHPIFTAFKLLWLKSNRPEIWKKARYFLCFEDLLQFHLGIEPTISWSLAGRTMMFDVQNHEWSSEILKEIGLDKSRLARPLQSGDTAGKISSKISNAIGVSEGALIVTGGHDQTCNALGAGVTKEGVAMLATGTVECITAAFTKPIFNEKLRVNNLCTYDYVIQDTYTSSAYNLTGGNILSWFANEFGELEKEKAKKTGTDYFSLILEQLNDEPTDLLVLPYFTSSGTPYFDRTTKGTIYGLRLSTKRGEILTALLEGVAFEMKLNLEILEDAGYGINELRAVGGGAKSNAWIQLKANVMGKKIHTLNIKETGIYGVSMLACSAISERTVADIVKQWVKPEGVLVPNKKYENHYKTRLESYKKLYQSIKGGYGI